MANGFVPNRIKPEVVMPDSATLESEFEAVLTGYYGSCTFFNDVPSDWGVTIIEVACKFIDDNGNNDNKGAVTNLPGNGASYTLTSSYNGCCRSYIGLVKVRDRGKIDIYPFSKTVEPGYCGGNLKWHLVPSRMRPVDAGAPQRFELLEATDSRIPSRTNDEMVRQLEEETA